MHEKQTKQDYNIVKLACYLDTELLYGVMCWETLENFQQVFFLMQQMDKICLKYPFFAKPTEGNFTIAQKIFNFWEVGMSIINEVF